MRRNTLPYFSVAQGKIDLMLYIIIGIIFDVEAFEVRLLEGALRFLKSLPTKNRAKAFRSIDLLRELGPELPMPHSRILKGTGGLRELGIKFASDIVRLFYFHYAGRVYVITSGFVKKTDKTDVNELQKAVRMMQAVKEM